MVELFFSWIAWMLFYFFDLTQVPVEVAEDRDVSLMNVAATGFHKIHSQVLLGSGDIANGFISHL